MTVASYQTNTACLFVYADLKRICTQLVLTTGAPLAAKPLPRIGGAGMTTAVRVSGELVKEAKIYSKIDKRSITGQIEHWARIGKCAEDNPDLIRIRFFKVSEESLCETSEKASHPSAGR